MAGEFWLNSSGELILNTSGEAVTCDNCPCEECPGTELVTIGSNSYCNVETDLVKVLQSDYVDACL